MGVYVGTRNENVSDAMAVIGAELERLQADAVTDEELTRAREHVKGRIVLSMESTANRMHRLGRSVLTGMPLLSPDEVIAKLDAVNRDQIQALAHDFYVPDTLSAAAIGRDEEVFRDALGSVNSRLAAA
jgi:predicted Zn-dependent peptidase